MPAKRSAFALTLALGLLWPAALPADEDGTGLVKNGQTYTHTASKVSFTVPEGWEVLPPKKLASASVLGLDRPNPRVAVTLFWSPIEGRKWEDIVRLQPDDAGSYGEEFAVLARIYGKEKVEKPTTVKVGGRTVYKIVLNDGPTKDGKTAGVLYVFPAAEGKWKIKLRASFPQADRAKHEEAVAGLLKNFSEGK